MFLPDREELAWATGFYDGEGCTRRPMVKNPNGTRTRRLTIEVNQNHPEALERFRLAVGVGRVNGPYGPYSTRPNQGAHWTFRASSFEDSQAVLAFLWRWLGSIKRQQAADALRSYHRQPHTR